MYSAGHTLRWKASQSSHAEFIEPLFQMMWAPQAQSYILNLTDVKVILVHLNKFEMKNHGN